MDQELIEKIEQLVSYYHHHSIEKFVKGREERLQNFVIDDFTGLLSALEQWLENKED